MKKYIVIILALLLLVSSTFAINPNDYTNTSKPSDTSASKIINYIESKRKDATGNVFCIGIDSINYYSTFLDEERDYHNLPFSEHLKANSKLTQQQKQVNPLHLQFKYEHNPNYYHNPVSVSGLSGTWHDLTLTWDSKKNKWQLKDPSSAILFNTPTDDKRGEWTIYVKGTDSTGKPVFDKESIGFAKFRVHKAPIPKFAFTEDVSTVTLSDNGSYDLDWQYKVNNGIKQYYWSAKIGENWVDIGTGKTVTFNKNGQAVTDYMLTVEDLDGAFASISKNSLILDKPFANFEFKLGSVSGQSTTNAYKGNVNHENVYVVPTVAWNDEAYDPNIYGSGVSGIRTEKWVSLNTLEERTDHLSFNNQVLIKRFEQNIKNDFIKVLLEVKNRYDLADNTNKSLHIKNIELQDLTSTGYVHANCGFEVGKTATIKIKIPNTAYLDDLNFKVDIPSLSINNLQLEPVAHDKSLLVATIPLDAANSFWNPRQYKFDYAIKVYSKRTETGKVLHQVSGTALIHTPLDLVPFINSKQEDIIINADENTKFSATTREYAEKVTVSVPLSLIDPATNQKFMPNTAIPLYPKENNTKWERVLVINADGITDEKIITAKFDAISFNKRDTDTKYLDFKAVAYKLMNFRVVQVKDYSLESYYKDLNGRYQDKDMNVNEMAIDPLSFAPYPIESLKKGYLFEFEIDSINFNGDNDSVNIVPSFYSIIGNTRDSNSKDAFWIDSNKVVQKVGEGAHANYKTITLNPSQRTITDKNRATWRGSYFIPATTFLTNKGTSIDNAKNNALSGDLIVNFDIKGYKKGSMKFDYNLKQWGLERIKEKFPYVIGDVIRYGEKSNLDDLTVTRPR